MKNLKIRCHRAEFSGCITRLHNFSVSYAIFVAKSLRGRKIENARGFLIYRLVVFIEGNSQIWQRYFPFLHTRIGYSSIG